MDTIFDLQKRAAGLRDKTLAGSVTPEEVGGLQYDTLEYVANLEQMQKSLGIRKVYGTVDEMLQDESPVADNGVPLKFGQLVAVRGEEGADGDIYVYQGVDGWKFFSKYGPDIADMNRRLDGYESGLLSLSEGLAYLNCTIVNFNRKYGIAGTVTRKQVIEKMSNVTAVDRGIVVIYYAEDGWHAMQYKLGYYNPTEGAKSENWVELGAGGGSGIDEEALDEALKDTVTGLYWNQQWKNDVDLNLAKFNGNTVKHTLKGATETAAGVMSADDKKKLNAIGRVESVQWDGGKNLNDYKTAGVYDIYGERTDRNDNLPITNASSGHSIAARLTVVVSTLQPENNEICVTQFLQLSNRLGGDGAAYVRTYNENNGGTDGWSPWRKEMGMVESYVNTDTVSLNTGNSVVGSGLKGMIDNGMYSGVYTSENYLQGQSPSFLETFVLVVVNDYAVAGMAGTARHITQLKYAVDAITGQSTVKKRVGTGGDSISWGDWEDVGGSGSNEVDVTDYLKQYDLPTLVAQGLVNEGVTYKIKTDSNYFYDIQKLDVGDKIRKYVADNGSGVDEEWVAYIKKEQEFFIMEVYGYLKNANHADYFKFVVSSGLSSVNLVSNSTYL